MVRDLLTSVIGYATWPCDEINPIWRHGNRGHLDDELAPGQATTAVRRYVRARFDRISRRSRAGVVVEKTCANSLRVAFVDRVLPDARFVVIERDGYDAVASALQRWHASLDLSYTLRKARYVPITDVPSWAWRFLRLRAGRGIANERPLPSWGPRFAGMDTALRTQPLPTVAALQWARCVARSRADLAALPPERVHWLGYERLVVQPSAVVGDLLEWCGVNPEPRQVGHLTAGIRRDRIGHGREQLGQRTLADIAPIIDQVGAAT
jgi:hypothetical protein